MKKHFILTSLAAIVATGAAHAATDVTFDGYYNNHTKQVISGDLAAYTVNYSGTNADGSSTSESMTTKGADTEAIDLSKFAFTLADGTTTDLENDTTVYAATDYTAATKAGTTGFEEVIVAEGYGLNADKEHALVEASSYSYVNPQQDADNEVLVLDGNGNPVVKDLTKDFVYSAASSEFTGEDSKTTIDKNSTTLDGTAYVLLKDSADNTYTLSEDGTGILMNGVTYAGTPAGELATKFDDAKAAYADDALLFADAVIDLSNEQSTLVTNAGKAKDVYLSDQTAQNTLAENYGTYTAAKTAEGLANTALSTKQDEYNTDNQKLADARALYNAPIETTIDDAIEASVENGSVKTALDGKADADTVYTKDEADDKFLTEHQDISGKADKAEVNDALDLKADKTYVDGELSLKANTADVNSALDGKADKATTLAGYNIQDAYTIGQVDGLIATEQEARIAGDELTLSKANSYTDTVANGLRGEFAAADALTLRSANAYTDSKVKSLEKNMSGGVAAATALSAVSVGNVNRGEVSVGGGYGYFNGQSAMAFGAAMGLSDSWSINAGAGIASGDSTQFSIRAGTNYKFKLF